jgi:Uma2 family endonuclease
MTVVAKEQAAAKREQSYRHFIEVEWPVRRFTLAEYHCMGEIELFRQEEHFELLNGLLIWNTDRMDMDEVQKSSFLHTELPLRRFSVDEYNRLIGTGLLAEDEQLELIDGLILAMSPINPKHAGCLDTLLELFFPSINKRAILRLQSPITLEISASQPQPDLTLVSARPKGYFDRHPTVQEVLLIVEVADSSLEDDQERKLELYARSGIPEYWIANLVDEQFEVYRDPYTSVTGKADYKTKLTFTRGQTLAPLAFPDCQIAVEQVIPVVATE